MVALLKRSEIGRVPIGAGKLVRYAERPGIWRVLGIAGIRAEIEPHDEAAAAMCHISEAYSIPASIGLLEAVNCG